MKLNHFWIYQKERFPLAKTAPLLAVFSAASISVSAEMAGRSLPGWGGFVAGFVIAMLLFFQMRVCDEYKDFEDDLRYRPERPVPRGLVSLKELITLGVLSLPVAALAAWWWYPPTLWLLGLVWVWLAAMTFEFGVPKWLKARPVLYLLSHMAIMPLIDLLLTGMEWLPGGAPAMGLVLFLVLSFVNGCVLEIGRKLWAPESEVHGVDSYSSLWGPKQAAWVWMFALVLSLALVLAIAVVTDVFVITLVVAGTGAALCLWAAMRYAKTPTRQTEKMMDTLSGLWVFACYTLVGFAPIFMRII